MSSKLTTILDALPSDDYTVGGESWNQIIKILKNINVESEEDLTINTKIKWQSGKLVLLDAGAPATHEVIVDVENIVDGDPRHLVLRAYNNTTDYIGLEKEPQTFLFKTLGDNAIANSEVKFGKDPNFQGYTLDRVGVIKIEDTGDRNIQLLSVSNTNPNTYFEILPSYNTANHTGISTATDIKVRFGFGSEIDSYEWWSQADGDNTKLLSLSETLLDIPSTTINFNNSTIQNILLAKSQIPSTVVHTDQHNTYSSGVFQNFRSGYTRIYNPAGNFLYSIVAGAITGSYNLSIPIISAHDSFALQGISNTFTSWQKISFNGGANLSIYRPNNTQWELTGIVFNFNTSTGAESNYAALYGQIWSNVNGAQNGGFNFRAARSGTLAQVATINYSGQLSLYNSNNFAAVFDPVNLTAERFFTLPDVAGTFAIDARANIFTDVQTIQKDTADLLSIYRLTNVATSSIGFTMDAWDSGGAKTTYGRIKTTIEDNTNTSEDGNLRFDIMSNGSLSTKFIMHGNGNFFMGPAQQLVFTWNGISSQRVMSFPDVTTKLAGEAWANVFTQKQKIQQSGSNDHLILYRDVKTAGSASGVYYKLNNSNDVETTYASWQGGIGSAGADTVAGAENGQLYGFVKVAGVDTLKMQMTKDTLWLNGLLPRITVGSGDLYSMYIYRPVNSSGSNLINFSLQDINSAQKTFGYVGVRSETITAGAELGSVQLGAMVSGTLQLQAKIQNYQTWLYNSGGLAAILDPTGLSSNRVYTFPDQAGQITLNTATQVLSNKTLTAPIINAGQLNGTFTSNGTFLIRRDAVAATSEGIMSLQVSDSASYIAFSNNSVTNSVFTPIMTTYNDLINNDSAVGLEIKSYIEATADASDSSNAVQIFSVRRVGGDIVNRKLWQFRNNATNIFQIYTDRFDFTNKKLVNATMNWDEVTVKHSTTNVAGDIPFFDGTRYTRKAQGSNNQFLGVVGGVLGYYTPTVGGVLALAGLTDDVDIASLQDNDVIRYDSTSGKWKNEQLNTTAGLVSNIGGGHEIFKQLAATNELRTLVEGMGIDLTQNADTITVALGSTITLPAGVGSMITFTKPNSGASGAERLMKWTVDDDPNGSELTIENLTGNQNIFAPGFIFSQYSTAVIPSAIILGRIADGNDIVNTVPAISLNARRPTGPIVDRPLFGIQNYTDAYDFMVYKNKIDFGGNLLQNGVVDTTLTGIKSVNIANDAAIPISKINVAGGLATTTSAGFVELATDGETAANVVVQGSDSRLSNARVPTAHSHVKSDLPATVAYEDELNTFSSQQIFTANQFDPILIRRFTNVVGNTTGIHFQLTDSLGNNQSYAHIEARIGTNTNGSETGFLDFYTIKNGTMGHYMVLDGNQLSLGLSGARAVLDSSNINTTSKTFNFPNLSGQLVTQEYANIFTAAQKISLNSTTQLTLYKPINTNFTQWGLDFSANNSASVETVYGKVWCSLEDSNDASKDSYIGFSYYVNNTFTRRFYVGGSGIGIGASGVQALLSNIGLSADRAFAFPDSDQTLLGRTDTATVTNKTISGLKQTRLLVNTTPVTLAATDTIVHVDATSGARTINLPAAGTVGAGQTYFIQKIDSSANAVTIDANSTETINGALTFVLTAQYQIVTVISDGSNWITGSYTTERRGKSTASGNGSATTFNVPHGLGSNPHDALIQCSSHNIDLSYTTDATNIIVTFASAPPSGTNNVIFHWSAVP